MEAVKKNGLAVLLVLMIAAAAGHYALGRTAIKPFSATFDEPVHLTAGYAYWKAGNVAFNGFHHPPFGEMWAALGILTLNPILPAQRVEWARQEWNPFDQYSFADSFVYKNRVGADVLMEAGRRMQLILSSLMVACIVWVAFLLGGWGAALLAGALAAPFPAFLAAGTIVATDLAFVFFFFGFFASLVRWRSWTANVLGGLSLGLCIVSKYFALALLPIVGLMFAIAFAMKTFPQYERRRVLAAAGVILAGTVAVVIAIYASTDIGVFWRGLTSIFGRSQEGRSSFLMGEHGRSGWLSYFPIVFFIKTPEPILFGFLASAIYIGRRKISLPLWLWVPPICFFAMACVSKVQIGHRHILAVYPFLIVLIAVCLNQMFGARKWLAIPVVVWAAAVGIKAKPYFLSYFNPIAGGPARGYEYVTDSNIDWGQGLRMLSESLDEGDVRNGIYLSYFGVADPHFYGIRYRDVGSDKLVARKDDSVDPTVRPTKFAISVTNYQATYFKDPSVFDWLKAKKPLRVVAQSILVFDFANDPESIAHLEQLRG